MIKRKPFFIRGNFQLAFILCYILILSAGIICASVLIYAHLKEILEKAVFSSHLNLKSSHELFWGTILKVNFWLACASIAVGLLAITLVYFYLEAFFASLLVGLEKLAHGNTSFRLEPRRLLGMRLITNEFNEVADALENETIEIEAALEWILSSLNSPTRESFRKIREIQLRIENKLSR